MNKSDFIRAVANKAGLTLKDATNAYESVIDAITETLQKGEKIQLSGFGTFELKKKPAREGLNPRTNEKISVPASKTPVFKFGKVYKDSFND